MSSAEQWKEANGIKFFTKRWSVPEGKEKKAHLFFVHGFMEHITRYDHWFPKFTEEGIEVFSYDQRGFGETASITKTQGMTSWPKQFADLDHFLTEEIEKAGDTPTFLMGHSMGGGLVLGYATRQKAYSNLSKLSGLIASAPLILQYSKIREPKLKVQAGGILGSLLPSLQVTAPVDARDICHDEEVQKAYINDPLCPPIGTFRGVADMLLGGMGLINSDYVRFPENLPLIIVHGTGDKVTDHEASESFVKKVNVKDKSFQPYDGAYHEIHNENYDNIKDKEAADLIKWISARIPGSK